MLSERSQAQKDEHCMTSLLGGILRLSLLDTERREVVPVADVADVEAEGETWITKYKPVARLEE